MEVSLQVKTMLQISRPVWQVFDAIIEPSKMSNYFIAHGSGNLEEGKTVQWKFPEFEDSFPVYVTAIRENEYISFEWDGETGNKLQVEISLTDRGEQQTLVQVIEGTMPNTEAGLKWLKGNTAGWANFLACLKAYLEYGINLRKGGFDYMKH